MKKTKHFKKPKDFLVFILGLVGLIYILNPTAGVFELIPDLVPLVGNMDEAAALFLLYSASDYFGINIKSLFGKEKKTTQE